MHCVIYTGIDLTYVCIGTYNFVKCHIIYIIYMHAYANGQLFSFGNMHEDERNIIINYSYIVKTLTLTIVQ